MPGRAKLSRRRKYRPGRCRGVGEQYAENELQQEFHAEEPGKVLTGDITYIRTELGWAYLAAVMDLYNREIVGYAVSRNIDTELVKRALGNAIARCGGLEGGYSTQTVAASTVQKAASGCPKRTVSGKA